MAELSRDDIEHPLCDQCGERHPISFRWRGSTRGWHDGQDERRSDASKRTAAARFAR